MQLFSNLGQFAEALETGAVVVIEEKRIARRPLPKYKLWRLRQTKSPYQSI